MLASPSLSRIVNEDGGLVTLKPKSPFEVVIENVACTCNPEQALQLTRVSIWVRIAGPEIAAVVATPSIGLDHCVKWTASFYVEIAGEYTIFARLLMHNAQRRVSPQCKLVPTSELASLRLVLMYDAPGFPFHARPENKCCVFCARLRGCEFSVKPLPRTAKFSSSFEARGENRCLYFRRAISPNETHSFPASEVLSLFSLQGSLSTQDSTPLSDTVTITSGLMRDESARSRAETLRDGPVIQLGCGRDEMLMRWAPCGSSGSSTPSADSVMPLTEDIVLFEQDSRVRIRFSGESLDTSSARQYTMASAGLSQTQIGVPRCAWNATINYSAGKWVRIPPSLLTQCGKLQDWFGSNDPNALLPPLHNFSEPIQCSSRTSLERIPALYKQYGPFDYSFAAPAEGFAGVNLHAWRSELSDSYSRETVNAKTAVAHVPGPFNALWALPLHSQCHLPPWLSLGEIRTCFEDKNISAILGYGDSIVQFAMSALSQLIRAAHSHRTVDVQFRVMTGPMRIALDHTDISPLASSVMVQVEPSAYKGRTVALTNLAAPHFIGDVDFEKKILKDPKIGTVLELVDRQKPFRKIWFTPAFEAWERWAGQNFANFRTFARVARERLVRADDGWVEIDYEAISMPLVFDTTPEGDSLHHIGPPLFELAQRILNIICR